MNHPVDPLWTGWIKSRHKSAGHARELDKVEAVGRVKIDLELSLQLPLEQSWHSGTRATRCQPPGDRPVKRT